MEGFCVDARGEWNTVGFGVFDPDESRSGYT